LLDTIHYLIREPHQEVELLSTLKLMPSADFSSISRKIFPDVCKPTPPVDPIEVVDVKELSMERLYDGDALKGSSNAVNQVGI